MGLHLSDTHLYKLPMLSIDLNYLALAAPLTVLFALARTQGG